MKKNSPQIIKLLLIIFVVLFPFSIQAQTVINHEKFELNTGIWTGTGAHQNTAANAYNGVSYYRLNNGQNMLCSAINITAYDKVDLKFFVKLSSITNTSDNIVVDYRSTTTGTWTTIKTLLTSNNTDAPRNINRTTNYHAFIATIFKNDLLNLPLTPFSNTVQFRITYTATVGTKNAYIDNISISGTTFNTISKGPGGITANLETWLKADKITGTGLQVDNTDVNSWKDVGKGNHASVMDNESTLNTNKPSFKNNPINNVNFNPVVYFNNDELSGFDYTGLTNRAELNATGGFFSNEQIIVVINEEGTTLSSTTAVKDIFCGQEKTSNTYDQDISGMGFGNYSNRFINEIISYCIGTSPTQPGVTPPTPVAESLRGYGIAQTGTTITHTNFIGILNARHNNATVPTGQELHNNGVSISDKELGILQYRTYGNRRFWLARSQVFNGSFNGRIAEAITYSARKDNTTERRRIESYLAIKYGITLGINGTSLDYQNSDGTVIWSQTGNAGYNFNIAGIGRDDNSELTQKQSRTSNSKADVAIGLGEVATTNSNNTNTFGINKSYLVWGSNNLDLTQNGTVAKTVTLGTGITTTFIEANRKYKIVETGGDVAQTVISIPETSINTLAKTATQEYVLIVSSDPGFGTADIIDIIPMKNVGTNLETWYDFDGTKYFSFGVANVSNTKYKIINSATDFLVGEKNINLNTSFTVTAWIRTSTPNGTIIAKNGAYQFYINAANKLVGNWNGADRITSNTIINDGKWHYITVTFSGANANLYIDGVLDSTVAGLPAPTSNTANFSVGALWQNKATITSIFEGDIDEIRIWNSQLTVPQIQYIMNQEIQKNGTSTFGSVIPNTITKNDIITVPWSNLQAYYNINTLYGTSVKDISDNNNWLRIRYLIKDNILIETQTAPLPYISSSNGLWQNSTIWANGAQQTIPNAASIVNNSILVDWNIVQTQHNVESQGNKKVLGLIIPSNRLNATNDTKVEVSHYLKILGKLDLVGKSQLIQTLNSDLDITSSGTLERDQQGKRNLFDYNYWSSPVNTPNATVNNGSYSVASVFKDGTTSTPQNIQWVGGYNGAATTPITLSTYWLYKFQSASAQYANWMYVGQNGALNPGQGYTLKGSSTTGSTNYTFLGKPNNGKITFTMGANLINLTGNPYASALNSHTFINNNLSAIDGSLYFWDHFGGNTHILLQYQGGYATLNLTGGVPAQSHPMLQNVGPGTKIPKKFVPVGQGFFINSNTTGGTITFDNNQREFVKENEITSNNLFRSATQKTLTSDPFTNNQSDQTSEEDDYIRIRLGYNSHNDYHRQILLGFMNENATSSIDPGYDAVLIETQVNDMYFVNGDSNLVIQGDGYFNPSNSYPLTIVCNESGIVKFMIDAVENLNPDQEIYIYDAQTTLYHSIKNNQFQINLNSGTHQNRFSLRFTNDEGLSTSNPNHINGIEILFTNDNNILHIKNRTLETTVTSATLFSILGQKLNHYTIKNENQEAIQIPLQNLSTGAYIVKLETTHGVLSSKIIVK